MKKQKVVKTKKNDKTTQKKEEKNGPMKVLTGRKDRKKPQWAGPYSHASVQEDAPPAAL